MAPALATIYQKLITSTKPEDSGNLSSDAASKWEKWEKFTEKHRRSRVSLINWSLIR
jgi:hypothetical protein